VEIGPEIILQKQYRSPVDKVVIELPAGLIDAGETAEQAAVRELKEETGYVGVVTESSPVMFNGNVPDSPIMSFVLLLIDGWFC
jgi:ADP-ribose pyrophosphatase